MFYVIEKKKMSFVIRLLEERSALKSLEGNQLRYLVSIVKGVARDRPNV